MPTRAFLPTLRQGCSVSATWRAVSSPRMVRSTPMPLSTNPCAYLQRLHVVQTRLSRQRCLPPPRRPSSPQRATTRRLCPPARTRAGPRLGTFARLRGAMSCHAGILQFRRSTRVKATAVWQRTDASFVTAAHLACSFPCPSALSQSVRLQGGRPPRRHGLRDRLVLQDAAGVQPRAEHVRCPLPLCANGLKKSLLTAPPRRCGKTFMPLRRCHTHTPTHILYHPCRRRSHATAALAQLRRRGHALHRFGGGLPGRFPLCMPGAVHAQIAGMARQVRTPLSHQHRSDAALPSFELFASQTAPS